jgi:hypothetical protein
MSKEEQYRIQEAMWHEARREFELELAYRAMNAKVEEYIKKHTQNCICCDCKAHRSTARSLRGISTAECQCGVCVEWRLTRADEYRDARALRTQICAD